MFQNLKKSGSYGVEQFPQEQYEKTIQDIDRERSKLEKSMIDIDNHLTKLDHEIRKLISNKQNDKAKMKIREMKAYKKKIEKQQNQYNVFTAMKIQLEASQTDNSIVQAVEIFGELSKQQIETNEQLQDMMNDYQDMLEAQKQQDQLWKEIQETGQNQNDIDEEYQKYCQEEIQQKQQIDPYLKIKTTKIEQSVPFRQTSVNVTCEPLVSNDVQFNKSRSLQLQFIQPKQNQLDDQDVMFD